jgi:hypothetical protein
VAFLMMSPFLFSVCALIFRIAVLIEADRLVRRTGDPGSLLALAELVRAIPGRRPGGMTAQSPSPDSAAQPPATDQSAIDSRAPARTPGTDRLPSGVPVEAAGRPCEIRRRRSRTPPLGCGGVVGSGPRWRQAASCFRGWVRESAHRPALAAVPQFDEQARVGAGEPRGGSPRPPCLRAVTSPPGAVGGARGRLGVRGELGDLHRRSVHEAVEAPVHGAGGGVSSGCADGGGHGGDEPHADTCGAGTAVGPGVSPPG